MLIRTLLRFLPIVALCLAAFVVQRANATGVQATSVTQATCERREAR